MKIANKMDLIKINFSDFKVTNTILIKDLKTVCFYISGGLYKINNTLIELGEGYLKIVGYNKIHITSYNAKNKTKTTLSEDNFEPLQELCEIDVNINELIIKGFAKNSYNWIELVIIGGKVLGEFID